MISFFYDDYDGNISVAVEENTECQKLSIAEFKPNIFTAENEMLQTRFQSTSNYS